MPALIGDASVLLVTDDVAATYPGAAVPAVANVTFTAHAGDRVCVLGPNGGGKSTLFAVLTGALALSAGRFELPAGGAALVPQTDRSRLDFPVSAFDVALMGAVQRREDIGIASAGREELEHPASERRHVGAHAEVDVA